MRHCINIYLTNLVFCISGEDATAARLQGAASLAAHQLYICIYALYCHACGAAVQATALLPPYAPSLNTDRPRTLHSGSVLLAIPVPVRRRLVPLLGHDVQQEARRAIGQPRVQR